MKTPVIVVSLLLAGSCAAATPDTTAETRASAPSTNVEGMRAYVDPETGALTSKPNGDMRAPEFEPQSHLIEEVQHANGMTEWKFNGQVNEAVVATVGKDGDIKTYCSTHGVVDGHANTDQESNDE